MRPSHPSRIASVLRSAFALALVAAVPSLLASCADQSSGGGSTSPLGHHDLSSAAPASFEAHGSIRQVWIVDADPGETLDLTAPDGDVLQRAQVDAQGSLIFRDVDPGSVHVVAGSDGALRASPRLAVTDARDVPPDSFYDSQRVDRGYGYIETRDGTLLAINVYMPGPPENGPYPTVIEYSGYDPANPDEPEPGTLFATTLGWAAVGVNIRGTGCSGGAFQFFETLQSTDGYDAVEVIARQPWVKGNKVGMVGISYPGISQLFVAQYQPPHLAAITPLSVISDTGRGTLFPGGIYNIGFAKDWAAERQSDSRPGGQPWARKRIENGDPVCIANQKLRDQTPDVFQLIDENRFYHPEIADSVAPATFVHEINVPVFLAGAWQDEQTGGYFANMLDRFTGTDKLHFTLTNGNHTDSLGPLIFARWWEFLELYVADEIPALPPAGYLLIPGIGAAVYGTTDLPIPPDRFTDAHSVEEARQRFEADPRVRVLLESGAGAAPGVPVPSFELAFDRWPIPGVEPTRWWLDEGGRLTESEPASAGADSYVYDPSGAEVTTYTGPGDGIWRTLPPWNWRQLAEGKALAYATDPLVEDLVMIGTGSVDLWVQSTAKDVDLQVTVSEIRPDGEEQYVQTGWLRASRRTLDESLSTDLRPVASHREEDAADLPAGEYALVRIETFPFGHVFRKGSRVRITIEAPGGDRPLWKFEALPADGEVVNTIGRSPGVASSILLPVLRGVTVPPALPLCPSLRGQPCRPYVAIANTAG
ncbi:MAG TPA: CocE/NonD family hydrolase [Candidatus Binatia bacterium]|nr:CocE/NonD family hydrolase [Candidatus Binatia bacterium]